jgi:hypothetical protein
MKRRSDFVEGESGGEVVTGEDEAVRLAAIEAVGVLTLSV